MHPKNGSAEVEDLQETYYIGWFKNLVSETIYSNQFISTQAPSYISEFPASGRLSQSQYTVVAPKKMKT
jgi:hypothetical protein